MILFSRTTKGGKDDGGAEQEPRKSALISFEKQGSKGTENEQSATHEQPRKQYEAFPTSAYTNRATDAATKIQTDHAHGRSMTDGVFGGK